MENTLTTDLHRTEDYSVAHCNEELHQSLKDHMTLKKDEPKCGQYNILLCCCLWGSTLPCFEAVSFTEMFSSFLYVGDILSDIGMAIYYLRGKSINKTILGNDSFVSYNVSYIEEACDNVDDYSHPDWAFATLLYVWFPCLPSLLVGLGARLIFLVVSLCSCNINLGFLEKTNMRHEVSELMIDILLLCVAIITWPITGLIM